MHMHFDTYLSMKYTKAPQTVHNTPAMNIFKAFYLYFFTKRNILKKP